MSDAAVPAYPVTFTFDPPETIARWRVIGNIILAIPHLIVLSVLQFVAEILGFVAWILGVFTGRVPEGILGFIALYLRYNTRVTTYLLFLKEDYPPFSFDMTLADPGDDPRVRVDFAPAIENRNRLTIFFRLFLAIPQFIVLGLISMVLGLVVVIGWFAVLITGRWPSGLRNFVIGMTRWSLRVNSYLYLLTDDYPPFSTS
ncbi:DUF4389 domain-containing protein [Aeromicrobium sp. A1-2]|uniref:DUF4389 domain-containing protein n=1 Tax=Aeromicrobium sp. A1-2 TaxID=2107713 RepID=UPI0013C37746|nr:DUF4389 domain-containing protein [Aeromicrobium sp. A1-2]